MSAPLLEVRGLVKHYAASGPGASRGGPGEIIRALDGIDLTIGRGETVALVGESGSGKTTAGRCILRLEQPTAGRILFDGEDLLALRPGPMRAIRRRMTAVFQDPDASLNPRMTVGSLVGEPLRIHRMARGAELDDRVSALLAEVGLLAEDARRRPRELSGGQRQRVGIARALATRPDLLVCDEPVTALDVSIQAQVLNLLMELQESLGVACLFIAHDLAVVRRIAHRTAVLRAGRIVEEGPTEALFDSPREDYTRALLAARSRLEQHLPPLGASRRPDAIGPSR